MEIQDLRPEYPIPVKRVGFKNLVRRVTIKSPSGPLQLTVSLDLFVEISSERKGAHLSRNVDAVNLLERIPEESWSLEGFADTLHKELLELHPYSASATVRLRTTYWAIAKAIGLESLEPVYVQVVVNGDRSSKMYSISVTVKGMTVCPSAKATVSEMLDQGEMSPSHVQKVLLRGTIRVPKLIVLRIEDVAACLWSSLSAPTFTLLKKRQEARLVISAFHNPKFAEDVVRDAIVKLWCRFKDTLPEGSLVRSEALSLESIHPQNVYAMSYGTPKELSGVKCDESEC
ncbi:MAG: GTP cyclohydrolase I FolE2 [Acidilobus sp.]